ncbi:MAG: hypothetical protein WCQ50_20225 [Spirochaetota bacterium]
MSLHPVVCAALLCCLAATAASYGQDTASSFGGSFTARAMAFGAEGIAGIPDGWILGQSTGISAGLVVRGQRTRAEASFAAAALTGSSAALARAAAIADPGLIVTAAATDEAAVSFRLRTLWARLDLGELRIQAGRQVINHGRGELWSPADIFSQFDLSGVSPERLGTDALRASLSLGGLSTLEAVAAPGSDPAKGRYAARLSGNALGLDGSILAAWEGKGSSTGRIVAAADCKFDLGAGFYAEAAASFDPRASAPFDSAEPRLALGFDWSFGDFIVASEYYWNGRGAKSDPAWPGRHWLFASLAWSLSDRARLAAALTGTPFDDSGSLVAERPWRAQASLAFDSSQNSSLLAFVDIARSSFAGLASVSGASPETKSWSRSLGASLSVKF